MCCRSSCRNRSPPNDGQSAPPVTGPAAPKKIVQAKIFGRHSRAQLINTFHRRIAELIIMNNSTARSDPGMVGSPRKHSVATRVPLLAKTANAVCTNRTTSRPRGLKYQPTRDGEIPPSRPRESPGLAAPGRRRFRKEQNSAAKGEHERPHLPDGRARLGSDDGTYTQVPEALFPL
jgi:hypothetical protein